MNQPDRLEIQERYEGLFKFLNEVFKKDQSDPHHSGALTCYEMLIERQNEFVGTPLENAFWNAVSLEKFHMAQSEADKGNTDNALQHLEIAYEASLKGGSREWEAYVRGTLCYFKNDIEGLEREIPNVGANENTLQRLLNGLRTRGSINYGKDY